MTLSSPPLFTPSGADAAPKTGFGDEVAIDITDLHDVDYWTEALGVSETELRLAVAAVGELARDVRDHLGR